MKKLIAIVITCVLGIAIVLVVALSGPPNPSNSAIIEPAANGETLPNLPNEVRTFEPIILSGSGDKTSAPFEITTTEWTIDWSYISDNPEFAIFGFFIYRRGETEMFVESVLSAEGTSGSTYSYAGLGEYYVKVVAANIKSWEIIIKPIT